MRAAPGSRGDSMRGAPSSRGDSRGYPGSRGASRGASRGDSRGALRSRTLSIADCAPPRGKKQPYIFREKISETERKLLQKVLQDERWSAGRKAYLEQLSNCIIRHPEGSTGKAGEGAEPKLHLHSAETVITAWASDCIRLCLEDWDVERSAFKLSNARSQVEKLDKDKMDAHRCYMQELQMLREKIWRLERKPTVDFDIASDDLIFYEPLQYLEEPLRAQMKEIVVYKVKSELAAGMDVGMQDNLHMLLTKTKQQEATIKDLEEKLKDALYDQEGEHFSGHRPDSSFSTPAGQQRRGRSRNGHVSLPGESRDGAPSQAGHEEAFPPTPQSRRRMTLSRRGGRDEESESDMLGSPIRSAQQGEDGASAGVSDYQERLRSAGSYHSLDKSGRGTPASRHTLMSPAVTFFEDSEELQLKRKKWRMLRGQLAEARGTIREAEHQMRLLEKDSVGDRSTFVTSINEDKAMTKQSTAKMRNKYEDDLKRSTKRVAELETLLEEYRHFDDGVEVIDCCVGPGPGGHVDEVALGEEKRKRREEEQREKEEEDKKAAHSSRPPSAREVELEKKVAMLEEQRKKLESQVGTTVAAADEMSGDTPAGKNTGTKRPGTRPAKGLDAAEAKAASESAAAEAKAAAAARATAQAEDAAFEAVKAERAAVAAATHRREKELLRKIGSRPPVEDLSPAGKKLTFSAAVKESMKMLDTLRADIETVNELAPNGSEKDPHHVLAEWMQKRVTFVEQSLGNVYEPEGGANDAVAAAPTQRVVRLKAEVEDLRDKNSQLEVSLEEMQAKLKDMKKALADAGMEDVANEIFERVGLNRVISKPGGKVCVFDRLYNDAIKRIKADPEQKKAQHAITMLSAIKKMQKLKAERPRASILAGAGGAGDAVKDKKEDSDEEDEGDEMEGLEGLSGIPLEFLESMKCCVCGGLKLGDDLEAELSTSSDAASEFRKRASMAILSGGGSFSAPGRASIVAELPDPQQRRPTSFSQSGTPASRASVFGALPLTPATDRSMAPRATVTGGGFNLSTPSQNATLSFGVREPSPHRSRQSELPYLRDPSPHRSRQSELHLDPSAQGSQFSDWPNSLDRASVLEPVRGFSISAASHNGASTWPPNQFEDVRMRTSPQQDDGRMSRTQPIHEARVANRAIWELKMEQGSQFEDMHGGSRSKKRSLWPDTPKIDEAPGQVGSRTSALWQDTGRVHDVQSRGRAKSSALWQDTGQVREMHLQQATQLEDQLRQIVYLDMVGTPHTPLPTFHEAEGEHWHDKPSQLADHPWPHLPAVGRPAGQVMMHSASAPALHQSTASMSGILASGATSALRTSESLGTLPPLEGSGMLPREVYEAHKTINKRPSTMSPTTGRVSTADDWVPRDWVPRESRVAGVISPGTDKSALTCRGMLDAAVTNLLDFKEPENTIHRVGHFHASTGEGTTPHGASKRLTTAPSYGDNSGLLDNEWTGPDKIHSFAPDDFRRAQRRTELLEKAKHNPHPPRLLLRGNKSTHEPT